jgi:hypothetical protein
VLHVSEALVEVAQGCLLLQLTRVQGLLLDVRLENLICKVVDIGSLEVCAGLLQVQLLGYIFCLEVHVDLQHAVSSWRSE